MNYSIHHIGKRKWLLVRVEGGALRDTKLVYGTEGEARHIAEQLAAKAIDPTRTGVLAGSVTSLNQRN